MSKTQKGTRISGLPARVLLSLRQDATGSYPVSRRTASDNRTGKYSAFFPDTKTIVFNQQVDGTGLQPVPVDTSAYVENIFEVSSPTISQVIPFDYTFVGTPVVVIENLTSTNNSEGVNPFIEAITTTTFTVGFSAPFAGTVKFRAITLSSGPQFVQRTPLYSGSYTRVVADRESIKDGSNKTYFTQFNLLDEPLELKEVFITFFDQFTTYEADMSASIGVQTSTYLAITSSANVASQITAQFLGYADSDASVGVSGIVYPLGLTSASINSGLSETNRNGLFRQPFLSDGEVKNLPISAPGKQLKGIADSFITFTPGQDLQPFMDSGNPAVDGKLSSSIGGVNAFYATGSAVEITGPGFQQPLWSKNKIEIDITPSTVQNISLTNTGSTGNYPMNYWNPTTKRYEGIGTGRGLWSGFGNTAATDKSTIEAVLESQTFGFGASIDTGGGVYQITATGSNAYARQIDIFGFPYHTKFQPTSSQQINMRDYISEPFLLEKIVCEISSSIQTKHLFYNTNSSMWSFFLLNSRSTFPNQSIGNQTISYVNSAAPPATTITTSSFSGATYLDLIDYFQVAFTGSFSGYILQAVNREEIVNPTYDAGTKTYTYQGQHIISSSVKTSLEHNSSGFYASINSSGQTLTITQSLNSSGRNQITNTNGRDWKNSFELAVKSGTNTPIPVVFPSMPVNIQYTKPNPYLLLPTDKITFGFQLPWSSTMGYVNYQITSSIGFATTGINKITLYGSSLRVNPETNQVEEYHDTLNQLLSSNSIHEIIGEP